MGIKEWIQLKEGDIVLNSGSGNSYTIAKAQDIVLNNNICYARTYIVVKVLQISNPSEWEKV